MANDYQQAGGKKQFVRGAFYDVEVTNQILNQPRLASEDRQSSLNEFTPLYSGAGNGAVSTKPPRYGGEPQKPAGL